MKLAIACALLAAVNGQVELTSDGNDMTASRRQSLNMFEMSSAMAAQDQVIATLTAQVNSLAAGDSAINIGVTAIANDMTERTTGIMTAQATMSAAVSTLTTSLSAVSDNVALQLAAANVDAESRAAAAVTASLSRGVVINAGISTSIAGITRSVASDISGLTAALANSTAATTRTVAGVTTALAGKADNVKKMWSGGCSSYPGGGWNWYCLNRVLYNTAAGYFIKADNTNFRALRANMMINFIMWTITHGSGWNIMNMFLNGTQIMYSYSHTAGCWWKDMHGNMIFKVQVGNTWKVRMHGACSHSFHPGGRISDNHSRLSVVYVGQSQ